MTVLRSDYHGPSYITGFNKCCRGSYQRWGKEELLRCFHVPQEVKLYKDPRPQAIGGCSIPTKKYPYGVHPYISPT